MSRKKEHPIQQYGKIALRWVDMYTGRFVIGILLIVASIIMVTEPAWFVSMIDALRIPYAVFLVAFIMFFFLRGNYALATAGGIAFAIIAPGLWRYWKPANETPAAMHADKHEIINADFTVLHFNVKEKNKHIASVAEAALEANATIVSLQELRPESFPIVDSMLRKAYPYSFVSLKYPGYGIALYAQVPFTDTLTLVSNNFPVLHGTVRIKDTDIHIFAATTSTPTNEKDYKRQAQEFSFITDQILLIQKPCMLMGDLNAVPWSEHIEKLLQATGLRDSRKDLAGTYPAQSPMQIPIDYIFHSKHIRCAEFTTVGGTTSNHLGLLGAYTLAPEKKSPREP